MSEHTRKVTPESVRASAAESCRRRPDLVNEKHKAIVEAGGGVYRPGMMGDLVLFDSELTGSTLALPEKSLTSEAVASRIKASNKAFGVS